MKQTLIILFIALFFNKLFAQNPPIENLVFEGAGIRGIAYAGVLNELENASLLTDIKRVGGTSAGAITALMVSLGYNSSEIYEIISNTKFQKFNDGRFIFFGGLARLKRNYGWYRGNKFSNWLENIIENKTGNAEITFEELQQQGYKQLFVTATCLNKQKLLVFSPQSYPMMKVKDAVRISMSIPIYFEAVFIDSLGKIYKNNKNRQHLDVVVDGGIIGNFPIYIFDNLVIDSLNQKTRIPNYKTIGVRIDDEEQIKSDSIDQTLAPFTITKFGDYLYAFYVMVLENLNRSQLIPEDWERTIAVSSVGIGPKLKKLSGEQKMALIKSGEVYTKNYLQGSSKNP